MSRNRLLVVFLQLISQREYISSWKRKCKPMWYSRCMVGTLESRLCIIYYMGFGDHLSLFN
ncbi:hypothetical protein Gotur_010992 [Gossypium turneri]